MNERIDALIDQANELDYETWDPYNQKTVQHYYFSKEKFAELIVEECMWKIMQRKEEAIDNNWRVDEAMSAAITDISEHFGVEE
jgi:uncharacterized tellurite resistance protein B-like protein